MWSMESFTPTANRGSPYIHVQSEMLKCNYSTPAESCVTLDLKRNPEGKSAGNLIGETFHEMKSLLIQISYQENEPRNSRLDR